MHEHDKVFVVFYFHSLAASAPWFEAFRDCFFQLVKPSDHEFIRHFLACILNCHILIEVDASCRVVAKEIVSWLKFSLSQSPFS